jgi:SAM-dependent methyltransferase
MTEQPRIRVYDSQSELYHQAFGVFLKHTDQKVNARQALEALVDRLPSRRVLIDAGAGNGQVTAWLEEKFERTIAVEPSPSLSADLRRACPKAQVVVAKILEAQPEARGDFVLCSHVLYYINQDEWLAHARRMVSWLAPQGTLVIVLQNHETDCMRMLESFLGRRFDLTGLAQELQQDQGGRYRVERQLVPAQVTSTDFDSAYTVAEFMLNLLPISRPPARADVEGYVKKHFARPEGGFRFSCHQDFLMIRRG